MNRYLTKNEIKLPNMKKRMFNLTSNQRKVNQNSIEIPFHPSQNVSHSENKQEVLARTWNKRDPKYTAGEHVNSSNSYRNQYKAFSKN